MTKTILTVVLGVLAAVCVAAPRAAAADVPVHVVINGNWTVFYSVDGAGQPSCSYPGCTLSFPVGTNLTFSPAPGFSPNARFLESWGGACPSATAPQCSITVTAETTITAQFRFNFTPIMPGITSGRSLVRGTAVYSTTEGSGYTFSIESGTLPPGLTLSSTGIFSGTPTTLGVFAYTMKVVEPQGAIARTSMRWEVNREWLVTTGADAGGWAHVRTFRPGGAQDPGPASNFFAYAPPYGGGVRVAVGDVNKDAIQDVITGAGAGSSLVTVVDGLSGNLIRAFDAFPWGPADGVYVASGDVNGDGVADVIAGAGGPAVVRVFDGRNGALMQEFTAAVGNSVRVAAADFNADGRDDVVAGAGPGAPPWVRVYDAASGAIIRNLLAYDENFLGGVYVAAGDLNVDGYPEVVTGAGQGGGPHVRVFNNGGAELLGFFAYDPTFSGGVRVAVGDVTGDGFPKILTAAGPGGGPHVRVLRVEGGCCGGDAPMSVTDVDNFFAYANFSGGVFVAAPAPLHHMQLDAPSQGATVSADFDLYGWAAREGTAFSSRPGGIGAVHVWAYPIGGGEPTFVGYSIMDANPALPPEERHERPDVAAVLGARFLTSGYKVRLSALTPGTYDLVVYALDALNGSAVNQRVVRVTIQ